MEWVVTTGKTVEEARERALDQLGVAEDEAEFETLEEPKVGFLGLRKGDARVRARVRPSQPRPKAERRDRNRRDKRKRSDRPEGAKTSGGTDEPVAATEAPARATMTEAPARAAMTEQRPAPQRPPRTREGATMEGVMPHDEHVTAVREFVEGLVRSFDIDGTATVVAGEDETVVRVDGAGIGLLIGPDARTAEAIGDLSRSAVLRRAGNRETEGRVVVDVAGLRERRRAALERFALAQAEAVRADGKARVLEPMGSADRKMVHDALVGADGIETLSEGEDPYRRVVIAPAS